MRLRHRGRARWRQAGKKQARLAAAQRKRIQSKRATISSSCRGRRRPTSAVRRRCRCTVCCRDTDVSAPIERGAFHHVATMHFVQGKVHCCRQTERKPGSCILGGEANATLFNIRFGCWARDIAAVSPVHAFSNGIANEFSVSASSHDHVNPLQPKATPLVATNT